MIQRLDKDIWEAAVVDYGTVGPVGTANTCVPTLLGKGARFTALLSLCSTTLLLCPQHLPFCPSPL